MPSKDKVNIRSEQKGDEARPFTVFFVNPQTPEEVHTDTIMAQNSEEATALAAERHGSSTILHVRGIGETGFPSTGTSRSESAETGKDILPCARFINGKFHSTTFNDDPLLESLFD